MKIIKILLFVLQLLLIIQTAAAQQSSITAPEGMIMIPGGWFEMGSETGQKDEQPVHRVYIDTFYISAYEVTIGEYFEAVKAGACGLPIWWNRDFFDDNYDDMNGEEWFLLPISGISWNDAMNYCRWKGDGFRLPTEAEWEFAARSGTSSKYFWGDAFEDGREYANSGEVLLPAGSLKPNQFGLYDMLGNVWEWCLDYYDEDYYMNSSDNNPKGPGPSDSGSKRVIRGGSNEEYSWNLRCANRNFADESTGYKGVGFRTVYSDKRLK